MIIELLVLQPLCITIAVVGLGLMLIELRTRFDRSFLFFGIFLLLLSGFCALDIWGLAGVTGKYWIEVQHVLIGFFCPVLYQYIYCLCKKPTPRFFPFYYYSSVVLAVLFISGIMFKVVDGVVEPTLLYLIVFLPFFVFFVITLTHIIIRELRTAQGENGRILILHLLGFSLLAGCGCVDLLDLMRSNEEVIGGVSCTIYGAICLGVLLAFVFSERLVLMINERLSYIVKLKNAYIDLEQAQNLSEIGKSAAIINHEIKNYTTIILGYAELIDATVPLPEKSKHMLEAIVETATKLTSFSHEILDFSKAKILKDKRPLDIYQLLKTCTQSRFIEKKDAFRFGEEVQGAPVVGDWKKLEQVFVNLFNNSFEAGADTILIDFISGTSALLVTLEDNGGGISEENLPNIFKAFHTTKSNGTGLGLPTCRSIIESHGGHISIISKNSAIDTTQHGLIIHIAFPRFETPVPSNHKDNIVLIEEGLEQLQLVVMMLRNVFANPHVIGKPEELKNMKCDGKTRIIGAPSAIAKVPAGLYQCYSLVPVSPFLICAVGGLPNRVEAMFNESFIMSVLLDSR